VVIDAVTGNVISTVGRLAFLFVIKEGVIASDHGMRLCEIDLLIRIGTSSNEVSDRRNRFWVVIIERASDEDFCVSIGISIAGTTDGLSHFIVGYWSSDGYSGEPAVREFVQIYLCGRRASTEDDPCTTGGGISSISETQRGDGDVGMPVAIEVLQVCH